MSLIKSLKKRIDKSSSILGYWASKSYLYSIYFNFKYLPFSQAKHLPITIYDTYIKGKPKISILATNIDRGMIRIGKFGNNIWHPKKSTLIFWDNGKIEFKGKCKLTRACHLRVLGNGVITFGDNFYASSNFNVQCGRKIEFGNFVTFGWDCTVIDTDYHHYFDLNKHSISEVIKPILISDNCWVGFSSIILKGCIIKDNSIISAGSVVSDRFKDGHVVIKGNPAVIVRDNVTIDEKNFW